MKPRRDAVVILAALDVRRASAHASELRSQLLLGERVRILRVGRGGDWAWVENLSDGYRGWVRTWGLRFLSGAEARRWESRARARVRRPYAEVREEAGRGDLLTPVFWNSRLIAGRALGRWRSVVLPDGRRGWIEQSALGAQSRVRALEPVVRGMLGIPYLWGGRTPLGFDCSGFVQQVLDVAGVRLRRDAHEQFLDARRLAKGESPREGDLVFFGTPRGRVGHVGVVLSGGRFAHARGAVRINDLDPSSALYDKELADTLRGFRRPE